MTETMSVAEWKQHLHNPVRKYKNVKCEVDGKKFDSRLEARRYEELKNLWQMGLIRWFIRQVPFELDGGVVYRADFLVIYPDGRVEVDECKGFLTDVARIKIKQCEARYDVKINLLRKKP